MMDINEVITGLVAYARSKDFIPEEDEVYVTNRLLDLFRLDTYELKKSSHSIEEIMDAALAYAKKNNLRELENQNEFDNFDAEIMDVIMPRPSQVIARFNQLLKESPQKATDYFHKLSIDDRYVRMDRLKKNIVYHMKGKMTELDITINLSKPEKDPKEIAKAMSMPSSSYPKCLLCKENEGYYGTYTHPGRSNHRIIPLTLNKEKFFFQYSPYEYFNEHCIVLKAEHVPMEISEKTFRRFVDFLNIFPHYVIGSNADLPIVGGSILFHEHFQGGRYEFPLARAQVLYDFSIAKYPLVSCYVVDWPVSVIRMDSKDSEQLIEAASFVLAVWRKYSDPENDIIAFDSVQHNTISPVARMKDGHYEMDLALRNNRTDAEYPDGIFHPHKEFQHIKKENIGLIEVMGLAILPGRLVNELALVSDYLLKKTPVIDPSILKHEEWMRMLQKKYQFATDNIKQILKQEVGLVFEQVLENCGVFKRTPQGEKGFNKFIALLK